MKLLRVERVSNYVTYLSTLVDTLLHYFHRKAWNGILAIKVYV